MKTNGATKRGRIAGFTLLEVLISVVLLTIITMIMASAMRLSHRSLTGGEKKIEHLERLAKSLAVIDEQMLSVMPLTFDDEGTKRFYFEGHESSLKVPTGYSFWSGRSGYVVVAYSVRPDAHGTQSLWASEQMVMGEGQREVEVLRDLKGISFEYFRKDPTKEVGEWVREWTDETRTPEKVRISLAFEKREIVLLIPWRVQGDMNTMPPGKLASGGPGNLALAGIMQKRKG